MFGQVVRSHRRRLGLTQEDLAGKTGLSVPSIGKIEAGRVAAPRQSTVRVLADAFGLSGPERNRFHAAAADQGGEEPVGRSVPSQLPTDVSGFTGRERELRELDGLLALAKEPERPVVIAAVSGTAGVGKSALVVRWAHHVRKAFPDGQLYVNLRGFHPDGLLLEPAEAIRDFLDALVVPPQRIPTGLSAQAALYRSLLANRRILVVLDNARDAEQVRPLLPGSSQCLVLVTSRNQLTPLVAAHGAHPITLDILPVEDARKLLAQRLGDDRVATEPDATTDMITACAQLPLALSIAAARARHTRFPLATLAAELGEAGQRLDALDAGDEASQVRAVLSWSYAALTTQAARLFRLLGLHPGPDVSTAAAASLAGRPVPVTRRLLTELVRASLLTEHAPGRYAFHDLLRVYAGDLTGSIDPDDTRRAAVARLLDHYTHTAYAATRLLNSHRDPIPLQLAPAAPDSRPQHLTDDREVTAWFTVEHPVLLAAVRQAVDAGFDRHAWQLAWSLTTFLNRRGHWHDLAVAWEAALRAGDRLADETAQAYAHRLSGAAATLLGRHDDADEHLRHALTRYAAAGNPVGQADTHRNLAHLTERLGDPERALHHAQQALALYEAAGHRRGQAFALNAVGWYHALLGEYHQALASCPQALDLFQQLGDRFGEAETWNSLGYAHHHLGHYGQAADCYTLALTPYRDLGDRYEEAVTLAHLGDTHHAAGNPAAARTAWQDALNILADLDHSDPDADAVRTRLHDRA
ncbi:MAG: tetratricopeptide repeat protein [Actinobacteria bacterium]|nr:MAG: tetratricopeptide repeat protein [Actinomycetota bacterium]